MSDFTNTLFSLFQSSSRTFGLIAAFMFLICLIAAQSVGAANFTVTTTADTGAGSLRAAINSTNATAAPDTITFAIPIGDTRCTAGVCTITLTFGELAIASAATAGTLTITNSTGAANLLVSGNNTSRVFFVDAGANLTINGVTITKGNGTGTTNSEYDGFGGGGIVNNGGALTLKNLIVTGNTGVFGGGILSDSGTTTLTSSTVSGNTGLYGGGIFNNGYSTLTLTNSVVSGNMATQSGGGVSNLDAATLINSTVSGNTATLNGGGISNSDTITLINSTVSDNMASDGGGIYNDGNTINLTSATVTQNKSTNASCTSCAGGIANFAAANLNNTIVAGNIVANASSSPDFHGAIAPRGSYNLIGNGLGMTGITNGDPNQNQVGVEPMLDPVLQPNGGTTSNHALLSGSPAIDKGNSFGLITDQRGLHRPVDNLAITNATGGDSSDIGAFEVQAVPPPPTPTPTVTPPPIPNLESDVATRFFGEGSIQSNDVIQVNRFLNELDSPNTTPNEFQRADAAPRTALNDPSTLLLGDGVINSADVIQAVRYLNELDPLTPAGGPVAPTTPPQATRFEMLDNVFGKASSKQKDTIAAPEAPQATVLRIENATGSAGNQVTVNLRVDPDGTEAQISTALLFSTSQLTFSGFAAGNTTAATQSCNLTAIAGRIRCSAGAFTSNLTGSSLVIGEIQPTANQILIRIIFTINAGVAPGTVAPITFTDTSASNELAQSSVPATQAGTVTVLAPTAATVSISGHVTTSLGRGIIGVNLSLTDSDGNTRTAISKAGGFYEFSDVQVGKTYVISATGKSFSFSQPVQVLNVNEETNEVNFIASSDKRLRVF